MVNARLHIIRLFVLLLMLLAGSTANEAWADVTYYILTKPFNVRNAANDANYRTNIRLEALRCTSTGSTVYLPAEFRSPLAKNFKYWKTPTVTTNTKLYDDTGTNPKVLQTRYDIYTAVADEMTEGSTLADNGNPTVIYVTYDYDEDNTILKLDGAHKYNIQLNSGNNLRYLCFNKSRNNRPGAAKATTVSADDLISDDFVKNVNGIGNNTTAYLHFQFYLCGEDPYNITIMSAYEGDGTYNEKLAVEGTAYLKPYKGSTIFAKLQSNANNNGTANMWLSPDAHRHYKSTTDATIYDSWEGFYKSDMNPIFNAVAVLPKGTGYIFVASKLNQNNTVYQPNGSGNYAVLTDDGNNPRMIFKALDNAVPMEPESVTTYTYIVTTKFGNQVSATAEWSDSYADAEINDTHVPASLKRKYCSIVGYYKDAALTQEIKKYSDVPDDGKIYLKYEVTGIPFTAIDPSASYTTATWYELTDKDSSGKKIRWDATNSVFKNNGGASTYEKISEFAFVGDPYELRVLYRDATETAKANRYVGGSSTLGISSSDYVSNSANISYGTSYTFETENLTTGTKTITFNVSGLKGDKKIKVTTGGTDASQIASISPDHSSVTTETSTTQTYTVTLNANNGVAKTMAITIQEYDTDGTTEIGDPTVITINQSINGYLWGWEIPADETGGSFELRQYGSSSGTSKFWQWDTASSDNVVNISTTSTRVKKMDLPTYTYTYNVVDLAGNIAIKATASQTIFSNLTGYTSIPEVIRSPFLSDETVTFYDSYEERDGVSGRDRRDFHSPSEQTPITQTPANDGANIYVVYTTKKLSSKNIKLLYSQEFNVQLNKEYIYWNSAAGDNQNKILSESLSTDDAKLETTPYLWHLRGRDPYCMRIDNKGYSEQVFGIPASTTTAYMYNPIGDGTYTDGSPESIANGMFVQVHEKTWANNQALDFVNNRDNGTRFIAMMSNNTGVYEVLAATGTTDYYHIGRVSTTGAETKIYNTDTEDGGYAHGADELRFELATRTNITYHLIDKSGNEIFKDEISSKNPRLTLPADYVSPLVEEYYYYPTSAKAETDLPANRITEISDDTNESGGDADNHVYVTYKVSDAIGFGTSHPHMLKFWNGESYHMEDGTDKLTIGDKIKAVYPYTNGDGNLNVYGQALNDEQMAGGTSTRSRWVWFFESDNSDPYHVKIHSKNTIKFNDVDHTTYLQTYAVHFDQETDKPNKQRIVTGVNFPGISGTKATEYAILGVAGRYKLLTINKIAADLDGDGNKTGTGENERRTVTSFEQYWKTYNMVRQHILGDARVDKNDPDRFNDPIIMPSERWSELKTKLTAKGVNDAANRVDDCSWHSYEAIANAVRWNGYNDKKDGYETKKVERLQHWYQTFDMGDGTFDIENANIPSALILLDRHGWEIMRKPIPTGSDDAEAAAKLAALRAYDSPMVKEYKFYSNAEKISNCHKYQLRMQNGAERDPIKVNGKQFTSTSLATLPAYKADQDLYVTYTVKEEYEKSYTYTLDYTENKDESGKTIYTINSETGTPSAFIVLQNYTYSSDEGTDEGTNAITANTVDYSTLSQEIINDAPKTDTKRFKNKTLWYVQPNLKIDKEMGIVWPWKLPSSSDTHDEAETKVLYKDKTGFDPYNLQLKNVETGKFFTIGMTKSILSGGQYNGDYTGSTTDVKLDVENSENPVSSPESYDHSTLQMTNQTFMAVQDINGNMQIMPRFDHNRRIDAFATLEEPKTRSPKASVDDSNMGEQTTFMVRPVVYNYRILDNDGNIAMRYRTGGEFYPSMPEHFKSPLADDFRYYSGNVEYSTAASTAEEWASAKGDFKKTATSESNMKSQVENITASGIYYFQISNPLYRKVHVTTAKNEDKDAVYEVTNESSSSNWDKADSDHKKTVDDEEELETAAKALTATGDYYYKINYLYKKVTVNGKTTTISNGIYADVKNKVDISEREITSSFAAAGLSENSDIFIRYSYNEDYDTDHDNILQGQWLTMKLNSLDVQSSGTLDASDGTGIKLYGTTKPAEAATLKTSTEWHWKFLASAAIGYYEAPDPYAVKIFNRAANYDNDFSPEHTNKMGTPIKVGTTDRFVILSHGDDYALVKADDDADYFYFLNGDGMTVPTPGEGESKAASMLREESFSSISSTISNAAKIQFSKDILHTFTYHVITKAKAKAATASPTEDESNMYGFTPYLPASIQSPLISEYDYIYYGSATNSSEIYTVIDGTQINTLYGLYDDVVYVRYPDFNSDNTTYLVPNKRNNTGTGHVAIDGGSNPVAIDITGKMPYNIIWYNDNMMAVSGDNISDGGSQDLTGVSQYVWYFEGSDPYDIKIKKTTNKYVNASATLSDTPQSFMLLKKEDYDYGVFAKTGAQTFMLNFAGSPSHTLSIAEADPNFFIPFALSTHQLVYHLVLANTGNTVEIPYSDANDPRDPHYIPGSNKLVLNGTTQRDLTSAIFGIPGDRYQLGHTYMGQTYCWDAGQVSIGDKLEVPSPFARPNCLYFYYIDNIQTKPADPTTYQRTATDESDLNTKAAALEAVGDYYYKMASQNIYRKVHVTSVSPAVVYEISGSTSEAYTASSSPSAFQNSVASVDAMKTAASSLAILGEHYYNVNSGASYYRVTVNSLPINDASDTTIVRCTAADYANAAATNKYTVASESAMKTDADAIAAVGDYYYQIGPIDLYKRVRVTTAKDGSTPAVYTVVDCTKDDYDNAWQDNATLNSKYKGLETTKLMSDTELIGSVVTVNVSYAFQTGLETNAGEGFVTSVSQNLWYSFETKDGPYLAHYTNAWGLQAMEGRDTRYTNDYLWTPLGDVYGFKMYNRYVYKTSNETTRIMTTEDFKEGRTLKMAVPGSTITNEESQSVTATEGNEIYELLANESTTAGYFFIHPVINKTGTQYYIKRNTEEGDKQNFAILSTTPSEWTFGLTEDLVKPYYDRAGYVGGLNSDGKTAYEAASTLQAKQTVVYNDDNIVQYKRGYYRLHNQPNVSDISPVRYASGYMHDIEKTTRTETFQKTATDDANMVSQANVLTTLGNYYFKIGGSTYKKVAVTSVYKAEPATNATYTTTTSNETEWAAAGAIPMHFYSKKGVTGTFDGDTNPLESGFTVTDATRGDIPIPATEYDPSTIFYFDGAAVDAPTLPTSKMSTQGLYVKGDQTDDDHGDAKLTATAGDATTFTIMDIGGAVFLIHDGTPPPTRKYLHFSQSYEVNSVNMKYDLKYFHNSPTDDAKWCLEPANNQGMMVATNDGGDGYFYSTFCAPFDVALPKDDGSNIYYAYICNAWNTEIIHPTKTPASGDYLAGEFVPAGTPVILRTTDNTGKIKLTLPNPSPTTPAVSCVFTGKYLEQLLATEVTSSSNTVYAFGLPITGYEGVTTTSGDTNGDITGVLGGVKADKGVGFYINATPNKEKHEEQGQWTPNNRYVIHNKIFYRATEDSGSSARGMTRGGINFVPVVFDWEDVEEGGYGQMEEEELTERREYVGDGCVYDMQGRRVATEQQVLDGSWKQRVSPGIYIINGKKISVN